MKLDKCNQNDSLRGYWKVFCSCLYPGRGPGPGPGKIRCSVVKIFPLAKNQNHQLRSLQYRSRRKSCCKLIHNIKNKNKNICQISHRCRSHNTLDSNFIWIFLVALIWLSSPSIVGCENDDYNSDSKMSSCGFESFTDTNNVVNSKQFSSLDELSEDLKRTSSSSKNNQNCSFTAPLDYYNSYQNSQNSTLYSNLFTNNFSRERKKSYKDTLKDVQEIRLKAIKLQILQRLGLKDKPNVKHTISRGTALRILEQADNPAFNFHHHQQNIYFIGADNNNHNNYINKFGDKQFYNNRYNSNYQRQYPIEPDYKTTNQYYEEQQYRYHSQKEQPTYPFVYQQQQDHQDFEYVNDDSSDFFGRTREIIAFASKGKLK